MEHIGHFDDEIKWRKDFGSNLQRLLHIKKITQTEFATKLGVTDATLSNYINGVHIPNGYKIRQMANILGCDINRLYYVDSMFE